MPIINQIVKGSGGGGSSTKLGLSIDNIFGDISSGVLGKPTPFNTLDLTGVVTVDSSALEGAFAYDTSLDFVNVVIVNAPDLTTVNSNGMRLLFFNGGECVKQLNVPNLQKIGANGFEDAFSTSNSGTPLLTSVSFPELTEVGTDGMYRAFARQSYLVSASFPKLSIIGTTAFRQIFDYCSRLQSLSFPALTSIQADSFGTNASSSAFRSCDALTEIHFPAAMQATIEAMSRYSYKWGATNATIYFDL